MRARFLFFASLALAGVLAACGGGGGSTPPAPTPTPTATATATGPTTIDVTFGGSPVTEPLPPGLSGTYTIPAGTGSATVTVSTTANSNTSTIDAARLKTTGASRLATAGAAPRAATAGGTFNGILYITITATTAVSLDGVPGFSVNGYTTPFYQAGYQQGFWYSIDGPSTVSGTTNSLPYATFTNGPYTIAAGQSLYLALYTGGILPSPNPYGCVGVQADSVARQAAKSDVVGVQPINSGATVSYAGTLTDTIWRQAPCPMPTAISSATVTITASASPDPNNVDIDEDSTETDAYATNTTVTNTTAVVSPVSGSPSTLTELKETSTDLSGNSTVTTYGTPLIYTITSLPYSGSAKTNSPPSTIVTSLADGTSESRTYNGTLGAYSETDTIAGMTGSPNTITVNSDGSASYALNSANFASQGVPNVTISYTAPSAGSITITENLGGLGSSTGTQPAWFSLPMYQDSVSGGNTVPASTVLAANCQNTQGITSFAPVVRNISIADPALGTLETETITAYIGENYPTSGVNGGPVCVTISDTQNLFYDYLLDTPIFFVVSGSTTPLQTDTVSETYWWNAAPTGLTRVRSLSDVRDQTLSGLQSSINAHLSGIAFARQTERVRRIEAIDQALATKGFGGIK